LRAWYESLLQLSTSVRRGEWHQLQAHGWNEDNSVEHLITWAWDDPATQQRIVVAVNDSADTAHGLIQLPWDDLEGTDWVWTDLLDGAIYPAHGGDLQASGLYVSRDPWRAHVLRLDPA
jgi:hypothetical protein